MTDRQMIAVFGIVIGGRWNPHNRSGIVRRDHRFIADIRIDTNHRWDISAGAKVIGQKKLRLFPRRYPRDILVDLLEAQVACAVEAVGAFKRTPAPVLMRVAISMWPQLPDPSIVNP